MLQNIVAFYNMAQQAVEHTAQSENRITWATIRENLGDNITQLTRMKFKVCRGLPCPHPTASSLTPLFSVCTIFPQNHYTEGEASIKAEFAKLHDDMQDAFRKLEE